MSSTIEAETSVKRWSTPVVKTEEGQPPGPDDHPSTKEGKTRNGNVKTITPNYKLGSEKPSHELKLGPSGYLPEGQGDYKVSMRHEDYKLTVIDPKVRSSANMPYHTQTLPDAKRQLAGDFPSEHSKRSLIKLEPLEQRRFKSVESRPITTSNYLTESVERHRDMEASRLRDYLKAKESEANKPWSKPGWPGPKKSDDESLRELEHIKKSIETLQKAANQPPKNEELDDLARKGEQLLERSRERRAGYRLIDSEIVKEGPEPIPQAFKDQVREMLESRNSLETSTTRENDRSGYVTDVSTATWQFSTQSFSPRSIVSVNGARDDILKDDKPRSIMKRRELETKDRMLHPSSENELIEHKKYQRSQSNISTKPSVTETVQRFEETRRTEEVERRVQRKERRDRRSRQYSSSRHHMARDGWENGYGSERRIASVPMQTSIVYHDSKRAMTDEEINKVVREAYEAADEARRHHYRMRSSSLSRGAASNGYLPSSETYYRKSTTRREKDHRYEDENVGRGLAHARYGSVSDSLRRGELKYIPNGEVQETQWAQNGSGIRNMHKSYSTRDIFSGGDQDRRSVSSYRRTSQQMSPFVEFPPTLPRRSDYDSYRPVSKSRSYADWDDMGRAGFGREVRRYDDDMSRLETEFRDSLLMPLPNGNMHETDHRTEQIPGGYETFHRDHRANTGRRIGKDGLPVDYSEASQEFSYKREQELDRRR